MIKKEYDKSYYDDIGQQSVESMTNKYDKFLSYIKININPKIIVDLGCGSGTMCDYLKKRYPDSDVYGLDGFDIPLKQAKQKYNNIVFKKCNLEKDIFPFDDNSIDLIVSHEVIEHLSDLENYLSESFRILKEDGLILLKSPNRLDIMRLILPLFRKTWYADRDRTHIKYYDIFNGKKELEKYCFSNVLTYSGTKPFIQKYGIKIPAIPIAGNGLILIGIKP
jgi:ubiquinone/menaquinone biosynthesis C-methylase UbiE